MVPIVQFCEKVSMRGCLLKMECQRCKNQQTWPNHQKAPNCNVVEIFYVNAWKVPKWKNLHRRPAHHSQILSMFTVRSTASCFLGSSETDPQGRWKQLVFAHADWVSIVTLYGYANYCLVSILSVARISNFSIKEPWRTTVRLRG